MFAAAVFAQSVQPLVFTFTNGANAVNNLNLFVYFPDKVRPVNLKPEMIWNPVTKTLVMNLKEVESYKTVNVNIDINGPAGNYKIQGKLIGQWTQIGQSFESDPIFVEAIIQGALRRTIVENIRSNPKVIATAKNIAVPAAIALEVAGAGALASGAMSANASIAVNIAEALRFIRFIGFGFLRWRRPKPWGKIYNQLTSRPIQGATVRVFEETFQKLKDTQFTDEAGRFGFLVAPGTYYLSVSKPGFQENRSNLITIKGEEESLNISLAMLPETSATQRIKPFLKTLSSILRFINRINPIILAFGTLASVAVIIILPTTFNFIILVVYLLLDVLRFILAKRVLKSFGQVVDKNNRQPIALAIVRIFDTNKNWLLSTRASDNYGRFKVLLAPGEYHITCAKIGYKSFASQSFAISKAALLNWDITLEPEM